MRKYNYKVADTATFDLTPLVDVLFILIIFFMLTSKEVLAYLNVQLPQSQSEKLYQPKASEMILQIKKEGYSLENKFFLSLEALEENIVNISNGRNKIVIAVDKDASAQRLVNVIVAVNNHDFEVEKILIENK